jgi:hypothetical protein
MSIFRSFFGRPKPSMLQGRFDYSGDLITGWVGDVSEPAYGDITIEVFVMETLKARAAVSGSATSGWRFEIPVGGQLTGQDLVKERVRVVARGADGIGKALPIEGSTQLLLIKEFLGGKTAPSVDIDFSKNGNSDDFIEEGWAVQGIDHRWVEGSHSALGFDSPPTGSDYVLEMVLWPLTLPQRHPAQRLQIFVGETEVGHCTVTHQCFLEFALPRSVLCVGRSSIRFIHPDAISPARLGISADPRDLALAFKRIRIRPTTTAPQFVGTANG